MVELIRRDTMAVVQAIELEHGWFIFSAPPFEKEFGYRNNAEPGKLTDTCWGICRNGVPFEFPVTDDYFGIAVVDKDRETLVHGYYTTVKIPAYTYVAWYTAKDVIMPMSDWNLICFVGYYRPEEDVLHWTDYREFTIKTPSPIPPPKIFPWLLLGLGILTIPFLKKKFT